MADLEHFIEKLRYAVQLAGAGGICGPKHVPEMLTRKIPRLDDRSIIDVLWKEGEVGWKRIETILDDSVIVYQDDRGDAMPLWEQSP